MSRNLSDYIEQYIKDLLDQAGDGTIDIQRNLLAEKLGCVPSQINYVLETRFTPERGYLVESRRGGGGYIRINRLTLESGNPVLKWVLVPTLSQDAALHRIAWLEEAGWLTGREAALMSAAMARSILKVSLPERDVLRAALFRAMLTALLKYS